MVGMPGRHHRRRHGLCACPPPVASRHWLMLPGVSETAGSAVSELFDPSAWREVDEFAFTDITYHRCVRPGPERGTVRIAFNRPEVRNAFRPHTVDELYQALDHARMTADVGCVLLTGNGPSPREAAGPSARAATSESGGVTATSTRPERLLTRSTGPEPGGCTYSRCSA